MLNSLRLKSPCAIGKVLNFNYRSLRPECVCQDGHIQWADGNCYQVNTPSTGPCKDKTCPSVCQIASLKKKNLI